jgi:hypothetical protein
MIDEDRTLFGDGRYPGTGPLALLARLAFILSALAIVAAVYAPPPLEQHFARSHLLEHFAAFYVTSLCGMAALPRTKLRRICIGYVLFAVLLEASHLIGGDAIGPLLNNWTADLGGLSAAAAPMVIERFRRRFAG